MRLRSLLLDNLLLKGVAVLLAVLIWHQVSRQQTVWQVVPIPLGFTIPNGLVISNDLPNSIAVYARSQRPGGVDQSQLSAVINLPNVSPGTQVIQLTEKSINRPAHVEIDSITPSMVRLEIEQVASMFVRVEPQIKGEPAPGFEVTSARVLPNEIRVSGPASRVAAATTIKTIPIDIEGRQEPLTQIAFVDLEDLDLRIDNELTLVVNVTVEEKRRDIQVQDVAVRVTPAEIPSRLGTPTITLIGSIPQSWTGDLDPKLFLAEVDLSNGEPASQFSEFDPQVTIPPEYATIFQLDRTRPPKVRARRIR